jgi:hypothetical protein
MALTFRKLHPVFVGESGPIELRVVHDEAALARIHAGMSVRQSANSRDVLASLTRRVADW